MDNKFMDLFSVSFWTRGGLTKEEFEDIKPLINQKNYDTWKVLSIVMASFFLIILSLFALNLADTYNVIYLVMLGIAGISVFLFYRVFTPEFKWLMPWIYFLIISLMGFSVHIGVVNIKDQVAVTVMVFLALIPMLVVDRPYIMSIVIFIVCICFAVESQIMKVGVAKQMDLYNVICFGLLSEFVNVFSARSRLQGYKMQSIVEKNLSTDGLTKVKNKTAYIRLKTDIDRRITAKRKFYFGLVVCDINSLKIVNDNYGHEVGDAYIRSNCKTLCRVFSHSNIYRIGGDEFLVYLQGEDLDKSEELLGQLDRIVNADFPNMRPQEKINLAYGFASYSSTEDKNFSDVFNRADEAMYVMKANMHKAQRL